MPEAWDVPQPWTGWTRKGERSPGESKHISMCVYSDIIQNICLFVLASSMVTHGPVLPPCLSAVPWVASPPKSNQGTKTTEKANQPIPNETTTKEHNPQTNQTNQTPQRATLSLAGAQGQRSPSRGGGEAASLQWLWPSEAVCGRVSASAGAVHWLAGVTFL